MRCFIGVVKVHWYLSVSAFPLNSSIERISGNLLPPAVIENRIQNPMNGRRGNIDRKRKFLKTLVFMQGVCKKVSEKYCYAIHELCLHQNDRCKRFALV